MSRPASAATPALTPAALLSAYPQPAAVFTSAGTLVAENTGFVQLRPRLTDDGWLPWLTQTSDYWVLPDGSYLRRQWLDGQHQLISLVDDARHPAAQAMAPVFEALRDGLSLFQAAVSALRHSLGWRWLGVSRFLPGKTSDCDRAEILVLWDTDHFAAGFEYDLPGMPCAVVMEKRHFCRFDDVIDLFPRDQMARQLGARVYAGKVYSDDAGKPLGHLFALHDHTVPADDRIETLFNVMTALLSAEWRALGAETELKTARAAARTDALTGLWNRRAFDEDLAALAQHQRRRHDLDAMLMLINLDGMKQINDSLGHQEGDKLLLQFGQLLATGCRRDDKAYRLGGDEFAVLLSNAVSPAVLQTRLNYGVQKLRDAGFHRIGASTGIAALSEANGDRTQWFALADARLYQMKQLHRQTG
ncbi:MAG: diguanylate cyclase domain-containing protein [Permianibacter sp.]